MLAASLVAASADPIGVWIAHLRGLPVPALTDTLLLYLPNYVCAIVSMLPSSVLHGMGRRLRQAEALGSYRLVELLGHGGMGEVWRAEHRLLARHVAIKLVRPEVLGAATEDEARVVLQRFEREAQATAALSSPHTIQLFDFGMTDEGTFYYVMELLAGRDLESARARIRAAARRPRDFPPAGRSATRSPMRTRAAWCIATSSRPISTSAAWGSSTTSSRCWTSVS